MTTTPATKIALGLEATANECETTPIGILRAFALGHLKGVKLPTGKHKFLPADIQSFIAAGCPGLNVPDIHRGTQSHGAGWFENTEDAYHAGNALNAVRAVLESQVPEDERLTAMVKAQNTTDFTATVQATPAINSILGKPVPQNIARRTLSPFGTMKALILGHSLREAARRVMAGTGVWLTAPLASLYGGTDFKLRDELRVLTFRDIIAAAVPSVLRDEISVTKWRTLGSGRPEPVDPNRYSANWSQPQTVRMTVKLPFSAITTAAELSGTITAQAF